MKWIAVSLLFSACAQTDVRLYDNGRLAAYAHIQGDARNVSIKTQQCSFSADSLDHSTATVAGGKVITSTTSYLSGLAAILRLIIPFMP